jgi:hypothetical protein
VLIEELAAEGRARAAGRGGARGWRGRGERGRGERGAGACGACEEEVVRAPGGNKED